MDIPQVRLQLFDMQGRLLMEQEVFHGSSRVNLSGYPDGTYLLKFLSEDGTAWFKLLKQPSP
jgi:hypothetical protein